MLNMAWQCNQVIAERLVQERCVPANHAACAARVRFSSSLSLPLTLTLALALTLPTPRAAAGGARGHVRLRRPERVDDGGGQINGDDRRDPTWMD